MDIYNVMNEYIIFIFLKMFLRETCRENTPFYSRTVWAYLKFQNLFLVWAWEHVTSEKGDFSQLYSVFVYSEATARVESDCSSNGDNVLSLSYPSSSFKGNENSDAVSESSEDRGPTAAVVPYLYIRAQEQRLNFSHRGRV